MNVSHFRIRKRGYAMHLHEFIPIERAPLEWLNSWASGRMKTTSVMQTLSGLSGRLSQGESDFTLPQGGSSEARGW